MTTQVAEVGATGRLGSQVCQVIEGLQAFDVIARLDSSSDLQEMLGADAVVDVTHPGVSATVVDFAVDQGLPVLVGTSGWSADRLRTLEKKVHQIPNASVFVVPNFSVGATAQKIHAARAAEFFESIEIVETHHAVRKDRGGVVAPHGEQTARGEQVQGIPVHSLRMQGVVASQVIVFGGVGETLTVSHHTSSPDAYRTGIAMALSYLMSHEGLTVGLEHALGVSTP